MKTIEFLTESFQDFVQNFEQNSQQTVSLDGITLISPFWLVPSPVEQQLDMTCLQKMDQFLELFVYSVFHSNHHSTISSNAGKME